MTTNRIDVHHHYVPAELIDELDRVGIHHVAGQPLAPSTAPRLAAGDGPIRDRHGAAVGADTADLPRRVRVPARRPPDQRDRRRGGGGRSRALRSLLRAAAARCRRRARRDRLRPGRVARRRGHIAVEPRRRIPRRSAPRAGLRRARPPCLRRLRTPGRRPPLGISGADARTIPLRVRVRDHALGGQPDHRRNAQAAPEPPPGPCPCRRHRAVRAGSNSRPRRSCGACRAMGRRLPSGSCSAC